MPALIPAAILAVLGAGLAAWALLRLRRARAETAELAALVVKLGHDVRGALSPALLMSERLEANPDPVARQAGAIVAKAVDRASELTKAASAAARPRQAVQESSRESPNSTSR